MNILSFEFITMISIVFLLSLFVKEKGRTVLLLIANIVFLISFGHPIHWIWLLIMALFTFILIDKICKRRSKEIMLTGIACIVLSLCFFKYFPVLTSRSIVVPLGISFYSFKMISVIVDVYKGKTKPGSLLKFLTYISFFPSFTAGPIHHAESFYHQLEKKFDFNYRLQKNGAVQCAFGMFEKVVFADYLSIVCSQIFETADAQGITLFVAIVLYSFQIYLDFDAYSNIAIGTAKLLGFELKRNFHTPYLSSSIMEFWDRWHISLSSWLKEYIYIPLGGNRKGTVRKYINIMIVFIVSGLWHGSTLCFLIWGIGHGIINVIENCIKSYCKNFKWILPVRIIGILVNFVLVSFLWIFFRSASLNEALDIISKMLQINTFSFDPASVGLTIREGYWIIILIVSTIIFDILRNKTDMIEWLANRPFFLRWGVYAAMIVIAIIFGVYGPGYNAADFIYASF